MKNIYKILLGLVVVLGLASCDDDDNFVYDTPEASFTIETPQSGNKMVIDSTNMNNIALTIAWDGVDSDSYSVEFAYNLTDFAEPFVGGVTNETTISWTNSELNSFLLNTLQVNHSEESAIDVRVKDAEGEYSNVVTLLVTPYVVTVDELFLNTSFNNFDPALALPMNMVEFNVFTTIVDISNTDEFNFIEDNITGETIWQETEPDSQILTQFGGVNLSGYDSGRYKIDVDLVNFTVNLELIVNPKIAVPGNQQGWDPPTAPVLASAAFGDTNYEGYVWLDGEHKFLGPDENDNFAWGNTDWGDDGSFTGVLLEDGEVNCNASSGYYFIQVDTDALTYSETETNWGLIGSATGSWDVDQNMTYDAGSGTWSITLDLTAEEIKFRANDAWDWNYGDNGADGFLELGGDNIAVPAAGNYTVTLDLSVPRAYTYTLTLN